MNEQSEAGAGLGALLDELLEPVARLAEELPPRAESRPERGENVSATIAIPAPLARSGGQTLVRYRVFAPSPTGRGRVEVDRQLNVTFPPGTSHGDELRVVGEGNASPDGGPPGDLILFALLLPKRRLARLSPFTSTRGSDQDAG